MKTTIIVLAILALFVTACSPQEIPQTDDPTVDVQDVEPVMEEPAVSEAEAAPVEEPSTSAVKEFTMTAEQWQFSPSSVKVNEGDTVRITIKSTDVAHGFALAEFGVFQRLEPGEEHTVEFVADKAGTYTYFCNVPCGSGHRSMKGTLVVE
ncbi:hypothetical protein COV20_05065 [Candidatus Woesearchaeota archaeon CG10_big_fil_rev_8_21_14_0_10_45_16]|nr:MAG: hypothetical protein COV20_05065 [Candidatus Woesearchaeota archaeon CG10_big_fil_rev_8_21_14_0_10_45_16]